MKNFLKKVIIVLITGSLLGGSVFYFWKNKFVLLGDQIAAEEVLSKEIEKVDLKKVEIDKENSDVRIKIINYTEKNIDKISPEKPASGLLWHSVKVWFIDDKNFYVDYKDEISNTRRLLISQVMGGPAAEYKVLGFFIPGDNGWVLKSGNDIQGVTSFKLYEKNEITGEWVVR